MSNVGFGSKHVRFTSPIHYNDQETDSSESEKESVRSEELQSIRRKSINENDKIEDQGGSFISIQSRLNFVQLKFVALSNLLDGKR